MYRVHSAVAGYGDTRESGRSVFAVVAWRGLIFVMLSWMPAPAAWAESPASGDGRQWLDKVVASAQKLSYEGTFVFRRQDRLMTMRITHLSGKFGEKERLVSLDGKVREIFRSGEGVACILPERKLVMGKHHAGSLFPAKGLADSKDVERYYRFIVGGDDRIAGRAARAVVIHPLDKYRYGYRVWIDHDTGLMLRSDVADESGGSLEQIMFTSVKMINEITPALLRSVTYNDPEIRKAQSQHVAVSLNKESVWKVGQLPPGFMLVEHYEDRTKPVPREHMIFSDGLASVSVFIEKMDEQDTPFDGSSRIGAVNAYGRIINGHQVTVMGEVPSAAVSMIGQSIKFQE